MKVVHLSSYRPRGGLRPGEVWIERAFPDRHWVIVAVLAREDGQRRVVVEPAADRELEATYSEAYFRRHFIDRHLWLRRQNERNLRQSGRKPSEAILHDMMRANAR